MKTLGLIRSPLLALALLVTADNSNAFYDPNTGRWLSRDPIGERGGLNLQGMVHNNPIRYFDRLGLATAEYDVPEMTPSEGNTRDTIIANVTVKTGIDSSKCNEPSCGECVGKIKINVSFEWRAVTPGAQSGVGFGPGTPADFLAGYKWEMWNGNQRIDLQWGGAVDADGHRIIEGSKIFASAAVNGIDCSGGVSKGTLGLMMISLLDGETPYEVFAIDYKVQILKCARVKTDEVLFRKGKDHYPPGGLGPILK